jgi:hypothetical protein
MTVALTLKVNDGLVLAADSASTLTSAQPGAPATVINVYNNANKAFNLRKGLPIGLVTWGLGSISETSIETLAKDLRQRFAGEDPSHMGWHLDEDTYTIAEVAARVREFMHDEKFAAAAAALPTGASLPDLGFFVVGYSSGASHAEEYHLNIASSGVIGPDLLRQPHETGVTWAGQIDAISRIMNGHGAMLPQTLETKLGIPAADIPNAVAQIQQDLSAQMVSPAMPIQDAIDLAEYLVDLSIRFSRFMPGSPTVGGPIECAAISKHEGFKWIRRKHYYTAERNLRSD